MAFSERDIQRALDLLRNCPRCGRKLKEDRKDSDVKFCENLCGSFTVAVIDGQGQVLSTYSMHLEKEEATSAEGKNHT